MLSIVRMSLALLALALLLAACGESEPTATPTPTAPSSTPQPLPTAALPAATATPPSAAPSGTPAPATPAGAPSEAASSTLSAMAPTATPGEPPTATPGPTALAAAFDPDQVSVALEEVARGLDEPVFAAHAGDGSGRLFVLEKPGVIRVISAGAVQAEPFLDIRARVDSGGSEQGLLGLAFHPEFEQNGRLFLYYSAAPDGDSVISRFQANASRTAADPDSEVVLLTQEQPAANHNGGMLAFGPDGMLYAGLGDGGSAGDPWNNGQSLDTWLGKLLRIDVDAAEPYAAPADNPFVGQEGARPEIWAYGLRNPWRFSFDRATGDLYIADVGQNLWEEVNVQPADSRGGENYGWKVMEGRRCFASSTCDRAGLVLPLAEYDHNQGCSITGGYVYRGAAQPSLQGAYFYGDYCSGFIWALSRSGDEGWQSNLLLKSGLPISSFGETEDGEVLVVGMNGGVYRLQAER